RCVITLDVDFGCNARTLDGEGVGVFVRVIVGDADRRRAQPRRAGGEGNDEGGRAACRNGRGGLCGDHELCRMRPTHRDPGRAGQVERTDADIFDGESSRKDAADLGRAEVRVIGQAWRGIAAGDGCVVAYDVYFGHGASALDGEGVWILV